MNIGIFINGERGVNVSRSVNKERKIKIIFCLKSLQKNYLSEIIKLNIPVYFLKKDSQEDLLRVIKSNKLELLIVAGFPIIFKKKIIYSTKYGVLNLHAGPLPHYRGGSPLNWQILNGEKKIGISFLRMNENIDEGNIYANYFFKLSDNQNIFHAHKKANELFAKNVNKIIDRIFKGYIGIEQSTSKSVYWHQRADEDGKIDWSKSSSEILNFVRALSRPYNGAYTFFEKDKLRIFNVEKFSDQLKGTAGKILFLIRIKKPVVICGYGSLIINDYSFEKKKKKITKGIFDNRYF